MALVCVFGRLRAASRGRTGDRLTDPSGIAADLDPEPDMLRRARRAAADADLTNVSWLLGADTDLPALLGLLGGRRSRR